jgi:TolC family type I secretion outer membrane protein
MKKKTLLVNFNCLYFLGFFILSSSIYADEKKDLLTVYEEAVLNDALLSSARIQNQSTKELIDQGLSLFLPNINIDASYGQNDNKRKILTSGINNDLLSGTSANYESYDYGVTITQPIFNYASYAKYKQNLIQSSLSDKQLIKAQQNLIFRVSNVYFETLMAMDEIKLLQAQYSAIKAQLAEAEARFELGLISITDVNEAKTKEALLKIDKIDAIQKLKIKKRQIESITGILPGRLKPLNSVMIFTKLENQAEEWVSMALENSLEIQIKKDEVQIADREIDIRSGDRYPTIDAMARRSRDWDKGGYPYGSVANKGVRSFSDTIGLEVNIPIYSGGYASSRVREGRLLKLKIKEDEEYLRRQIELEVRENYLNLQSNFAEINAYQQALLSAEITLDSTNLGFQVGLRNSVDVLRAQQVFFDAEKEMLKARYNYLINQVKLKQSVGMLSKTDIVNINKYLIVE